MQQKQRIWDQSDKDFERWRTRRKRKFKLELNNGTPDYELFSDCSSDRNSHSVPKQKESSSRHNEVRPHRLQPQFDVSHPYKINDNSKISKRSESAERLTKLVKNKNGDSSFHIRVKPRAKSRVKSHHQTIGNTYKTQVGWNNLFSSKFQRKIIRRRWSCQMRSFIRKHIRSCYCRPDCKMRSQAAS